MPDWTKHPRPTDSGELVEDSVASVIRAGKWLLTLVIHREPDGKFRIYEEGSDLTLETAYFEHVAQRLADMYLDGFREGYDRGYEAGEAG